MRTLFGLGLTGFSSIALVSACSQTPPARVVPPKPVAEMVFEHVAPSVVAIVNDDHLDREREIRETEKIMGDETRAPKHVIDVSIRKEPSPQGTGFMIEGNLIVTAAHVVLRPDRLRVTTKSGETVDAELVSIDHVRDVAILRAKQPLHIPALKLEDHDLRIGQAVWAMGHTGQGYWALSWGMTEGIASGKIDMFGAKLVLFDGQVFPGFSGGPVVDLGDNGEPRVVGVSPSTKTNA